MCMHVDIEHSPRHWWHSLCHCPVLGCIWHAQFGVLKRGEVLLKELRIVSGTYIAIAIQAWCLCRDVCYMPMVFDQGALQMVFSTAHGRKLQPWVTRILYLHDHSAVFFFVVVVPKLVVPEINIVLESEPIPVHLALSGNCVPYRWHVLFPFLFPKFNCFLHSLAFFALLAWAVSQCVVLLGIRVVRQAVTFSFCYIPDSEHVICACRPCTVCVHTECLKFEDCP